MSTSTSLHITEEEDVDWYDEDQSPLLYTDADIDEVIEYKSTWFEHFWFHLQHFNFEEVWDHIWSTLVFYSLVVLLVFVGFTTLICFLLWILVVYKKKKEDKIGVKQAVNIECDINAGTVAGIPPFPPNNVLTYQQPMLVGPDRMFSELPPMYQPTEPAVYFVETENVVPQQINMMQNVQVAAEIEENAAPGLAPAEN